MYNVLIVDDEPIHRRGLKKMIKKIRPDYNVDDAKNGLEALEYIKNNHVDIVITDIEMPIMNGLQLIENLGDKAREIKIIILSVYGYFEYAQKAISFGAFDYILKPVDEDSVKKVLNKAESEIVRERIEANEKESLKIKLDNTFTDYLQNKMNKLIYGQLNENEYDEINKIISLDGEGIVNIFELHDQPEIILNKEIKANIGVRIKNLLDCFGRSATFFLQDETDSIVSILDTSNNDSLSIEKLLERFIELIGELKEEYGINMTVGIGDKCQSLLCGAKCSFKHAKAALKYKFFIGCGKIINYADLPPKKHNQLDVKMKEEELQDAILKFDKVLAEQLMNDIFNIMVNNRFMDPIELKHDIAIMLEKQFKEIGNIFNENYLKEFEEDIDVKLMECNYFSELKVHTRMVICCFIDILVKRKNNKRTIIVETCKKYIEDHYMEDLSLDSVAKTFYFNPSYFSNFFKSNTNINFCEYLLKVRMNKAKELLKDTSCKVYEISKMVGYQDPKYFNRLFKKEYGTTPEEYRHNLGRN